MAMKQTIVTGLSAASLVVASGLVGLRVEYGPSTSERRVKIGNTMPYSGPASASRRYREIGGRVLRQDQ